MAGRLARVGNWVKVHEGGMRAVAQRYRRNNIYSPQYLNTSSFFFNYFFYFFIYYYYYYFFARTFDEDILSTHHQVQ